MLNDSIVIVGGGFAGVYAAKELLRRGLSVTMVSDENHFTFTPLLHEVATGSLLSHDITFEYESFFHTPRFRFIRGRVENLEREKQTIRIEGGHSLSYAYLVIATGSLTNLANVVGTEFAYQLKDVEDAVRLKRDILTRAQDYNRHVSVNVVGGGPTGLELVFDLDLMLRALRKKNPEAQYTLRIIHGSHIFCSTSATAVQAYIRRALTRAGIEIVCDAMAREITRSEIITTQGTFHSDVTILCAGVHPNTQMFKDALMLDEKGHIPVNPSLQSCEDHRVFALGDIITINGTPAPKLAQTAVREAKVAGTNIARLIQGKEASVQYEPKIIGTLFSLGFGDGVGKIGPVVVRGVLAWYLWRTVYLFKTPGLWNKLRVAFTWTIGLFQGRNLTEL
ncbi:MAG: FAD-dependent oxidoreductase [Patescibacteria group bacterium]